MTSTFPDGFVFGTATASYQIEGAPGQDGKGPSIWDTFTHTPGRVANGDTGDVACDHYHRWEADLELLAALGVDSYRFSIAWPRLQASGRGPANQRGLDFYSRLVDGCLERGIKPFVTLYHWDLPQALEDSGGWCERDTAFRFAEYAGLVAQALGDRVWAWATLNEPWCSAGLGYGSGEHAPGRRSPREAVTAAHHLNLAHGLGVQALRAQVSGRVGVVVNIHQFYPATDSAADRAAVERVDAVGNWLHTDPMLRGVYDPLTLEVTGAVTDWAFAREGDLAQIHQPIDFCGLNYYAPNWIAEAPTPSAPSAFPGDIRARWLPPRPPLTDIGWTIEPQGLVDNLVRVHARYPEVPLIVSENGAAMADVLGSDHRVHDAGRIAYLRDHLEAVAVALSRGVPVEGYFVWSLMDNFEWALGYTKRFGLYYVDYPTQARLAKDSADWYRQFLADRGGL